MPVPRLAAMACLACLAWPAAAAPGRCPGGAFPLGGSPPQAFEEKCVLPDGTAHGLWRVWYPNGQLMSETPMDHGREHGNLRAWWPNGQLMMRGQSIYGNRYRQFEYWDIQGERQPLQAHTIETVLPAAAPVTLPAAPPATATGGGQ